MGDRDTAVPTVTQEQVEAGQALYTKFFLHIYDWWALGVSCRFVWRCPSHYMLELYNHNVSSNHLDVGIGTGYFLDCCRFPTPNTRLALMDLNPNCLKATSKRLARVRLDRHAQSTPLPAWQYGNKGYCIRKPQSLVESRGNCVWLNHPVQRSRKRLLDYASLESGQSQRIHDKQRG